MSDFGDFLQQQLHEAGCNLTEFAKQLGYNTTTVFNWMYSDTVPLRHTRALLAVKFGYTLENFESTLFNDVAIPIIESTALMDALLKYMVTENINCRGLTKRLGCDYGTAYGWATGIRIPLAVNVSTLSTVLGLSPIECAVLVVKSNGKLPTRLSYVLSVLRYSLGKGITDMTKLLSVSRYTWNSWEHLGKLLRGDTSIKLANWLRITELQLYDLISNNECDVELSELETFYKAVTEDRQHEVTVDMDTSKTTTISYGYW